jgi:AraC-like DNA-binding protein
MVHSEQIFSREVFPPCAALAPYVKAIVISETTEEISFRVVPCTTPVIAFDYRGRSFAVNGEQRQSLATNGIFGIHNTEIQLRNIPDTGTILVFFTEVGAGFFFKFPLHEIFGALYSLDNFIAASHISQVEEQLAGAATNIDRVAILQQFLCSQLKDKQPDAMVIAAIKRMKASNEVIRMKELASQLHVSESRFEKRFRTAVGASPKKYASILRMQSVIQKYQQSNSLTSIALDAGYFDQAHFIKDFKSFTGVTPLQFFREKEATPVFTY